MSDQKISNIDTSNGQTLECDSSIACMFTCKDFLRDVLSVIEKTPDLKNYFIGDNANNYTVVTLPIGLRDLSSGSFSKYTDARENFSKTRAIEECRRFAYSIYDEKECPDFYKGSYYEKFVDSVIKSFSSVDEKKRIINLVSQNSNLRLSYAMVNLLLNKTIDGKNNFQRRRKIKEIIEHVDEEGNTTNEYIYYTKDEIARGELELRSQNNIINPITLDVEYKKFEHRQFLISIASSIGVEGGLLMTFSNTKFRPVEEIFEFNEEIHSDSMKPVYKRMIEIAKSDLEILEIIDEKTGGKHIFTAIDFDVSGTVNTRVNNENKSVIIHSYMNLLEHLSFILEFLAIFIEFINEHANDDSENFTDSRIPFLFGIKNDGDSDFDGPFSKLSKGMLENMENADFIDFVNSFNFSTNISPEIYNSLVVGILKDFYSTANRNVSRMIDFIAKTLGFGSVNNNANKTMISNFYSTVLNRLPASPIFSDKSVHGLFIGKNKNEHIIPYIYRNAREYMDDDFKFTHNISVIVDAYEKAIKSAKSSSALKSSQNFSIKGTEYLLNADNLLNLINTLTNNNFLMTMEPFNKYSEWSDSNLKGINDSHKILANKIDEKYGESFSRCIIDLPPIPFSRDERKWLEIKCLDLRAKIDQLVEDNPLFPIKDFEENFYELKNAQIQYAKSDIDDVRIVAKIEHFEVQLEVIREFCVKHNISDTFINNLKELETSLHYYSNPDNITFKFAIPEYKFKSDIGNFLTYHIGKNFILYDGKLMTCLSLYTEHGDVGLRYLESYFDPMFRQFSTTNKSDFSIQVSKIEISSLNKKTAGELVMYPEIVMYVTYGSSNDTHAATKFRTRFTSFTNSHELLHYAIYKAELDKGGPIDRADFGLYDIHPDFTIIWKKTKEQRETLSGKEDETTLKIYNNARGCREQFPFYDNSGKRVINDAFKMANKSYLDDIARKSQREHMFKQRLEDEKRRKSGVRNGNDYQIGQDQSLESKKITQESASFWSKGMVDVKGLSSSFSSIASNNSDENKQVKVSIQQTERRPQNNYSNMRKVESGIVRGDTKYISRPESERRGRNVSNDGWVTLYGKRIQGKRHAPNDGTERNDKRTRTPSRFQQPIKDRRNSGRQSYRSNERSPARKIFNSGTSLAGTPTFIKNSGSASSRRTEYSDVRRGGINSPYVDKRGHTVGANSPTVNGTGSPYRNGTDESYLQNDSRIQVETGGNRTPVNNYYGSRERSPSGRNFNSGASSPALVELTTARTPEKGKMSNTPSVKPRANFYSNLPDESDIQNGNEIDLPNFNSSLSSFSSISSPRTPGSPKTPHTPRSARSSSPLHVISVPPNLASSPTPDKNFEPTKGDVDEDFDF